MAEVKFRIVGSYSRTITESIMLRIWSIGKILSPKYMKILEKEESLKSLLIQDHRVMTQNHGV